MLLFFSPGQQALPLCHALVLANQRGALTLKIKRRYMPSSKICFKRLPFETAPFERA
jgi:hypothetical protein